MVCWLKIRLQFKILLPKAHRYRILQNRVNDVIKFNCLVRNEERKGRTLPVSASQLCSRSVAWLFAHVLSPTLHRIVGHSTRFLFHMWKHWASESLSAAPGITDEKLNKLHEFIVRDRADIKLQCLCTLLLICCKNSQNVNSTEWVSLLEMDLSHSGSATWGFWPVS